MNQYTAVCAGMIYKAHLGLVYNVAKHLPCAKNIDCSNLYHCMSLSSFSSYHKLCGNKEEPVISFSALMPLFVVGSSDGQLTEKK